MVQTDLLSMEAILKAKNDALFMAAIVATNVDELSSELSAHSQFIVGFDQDEHFKGSDTFLKTVQESSRSIKAVRELVEKFLKDQSLPMLIFTCCKMGCAGQLSTALQEVAGSKKAAAAAMKHNKEVVVAKLLDHKWALS